jgi:DNA modification methylase
MEIVIKDKYMLFHEDCLKAMECIEDNSIDLILCDLPYGSISCSWDVVIPFNLLWEQYNRVLKSNSVIILFGIQPFTTNLISSNKENFKYSLVWNKNVPTGMAQARYRPMRYHEDILIFYKGKNVVYNPIMKPRIGIGKACYNYEHYAGKSNHLDIKKVKIKYNPDFVQPSTVLSFNVVPNRKNKLHPTQKPIELCEYLIKTYTNDNAIVLDNCMGSGTTGVACLNTNRQFIGIEKNSKYFEIAAKRIRNNPK